ncbi:trypsin-like cysteine/serine peptidase domain-containing protein [Gorgonomyces haynaldii]|nr:trypsin-like cysteine/serine peptidase domain-containing protein [Gorgonomyces haynaldii]
MLLSLLLSAVQSLPAENIVGGTVVSQQFPWMASMQYNGRHYCGGSWINRNTILTAGHCTDAYKTDFSNYTVQTNRLNLNLTAQEEGGYVFKVEKQIIHPKYILNTDETALYIMYDVGIWKVTPLTEIPDSAVFPKLDDGTFVAPETMLTVMGWGNTVYKGKHSDVDVPVTSDQFCETAYPGVDATSFCAGYKEGIRDACNGDSGGPIYKKANDGYVIVGTVSAGNGCAYPDYPGLMTLELQAGNRFLTFVSTFAVGTPVQNLQMQLDSTAGYSWVRSTNTSFKQTNASLVTSVSLDGLIVTGTLGQETLQMGNVGFSQAPLVLASDIVSTANNTDKLPSGVLSIGFPPTGNSFLTRQLTRPVIGYWISDDITLAYLDLGFYNNSKYSGDLVFLNPGPLKAKQPYWSVNLESFSIGNTQVPFNGTAIVNLGIALAAVPKPQLDLIASALGATQTQGVYTIGCNQTTVTVTLRLGGLQLDFTPQDYIFKRSDQSCFLAFTEWFDPPLNNTILLGNHTLPLI